jgi:hypothetical protein
MSYNKKRNHDENSCYQNNQSKVQIGDFNVIIVKKYSTDSEEHAEAAERTIEPPENADGHAVASRDDEDGPGEKDSASAEPTGVSSDGGDDPDEDASASEGLGNTQEIECTVVELSLPDEEMRAADGPAEDGSGVEQVETSEESSSTTNYIDQDDPENYEPVNYKRSAKQADGHALASNDAEDSQQSSTAECSSPKKTAQISKVIIKFAQFKI